jgi:hypothetical protein
MTPRPPTLDPTPTITPAVEVVSTGLDLLRALIPPGVAVDPLHARLHALARTVKAALDGGATATDLLDAVIAATAPAPPDPGPPWTPVLALTLDEFAASRVSLTVAWPALDLTVYLTSTAAATAVLMADPSVWPKTLVWEPARLAAECAQAGIPEGERTVERLIAALGGRVTGWRIAPAGAGG